MKNKQATRSASSGVDAESFWQNPPVHPAAEKLPMMSEEELVVLRRDISTRKPQRSV